MIPNDPSQPAGTIQIVRRLALLAVLLVAGFALLIRASFLLDGQPYTMKVTPFEGAAHVQFFEPSARYVSPVFTVNIPVSSPYIVRLDADQVPVPGAVIEFSDTAPMPGRFKIRIGQSLFDVMEERITVDGIEYDWFRE